ncbi:MAG TPA: alpha/beta fold hydrolase, partial [Gemmatimonadales bacterium]|nr:alpha/beta fold hydrolase [Gemmatimonadales bacterium]
MFQRHGTWPAVRKAAIDYLAPAFPGDRLRIDHGLVHLGRTSFTMRQSARRDSDGVLIATAEFLFVCVDREGRPVPVPAEVGEYFQARPRDETADRISVNGVQLAVEQRRGASGGGGPAILFIHGFPMNRTVWEHQLDNLTGFRLIAPDLRGMGRSDAPDLGYSMSTYAEDLAGVLDSIGEARVVLCGISLGGYIAFEFLRRWRERVRGLILMDTRPEADSAEGRRSREALIARVREQGAIAAAEAMLPRFFAPQVSPEIIERVRTMILETPVAGLVGALSAMRDRPDSTPLLATLTGIPTLVVVGAEDVITPPAIAQAMAAAIPGGGGEGSGGAAGGGGGGGARLME